jgi:hypothetical protein
MSQGFAKNTFVASVTSASYAATASIAVTSSYISASLIDGLISTASYAKTASVIVGTITSASFSTTSSFSITASFALNAGGSGPATSASWASESLQVTISSSNANSSYSIPFTPNSSSQRLIIDGGNNLTYNPSTDTLNVTNITASLFGTSSWASNVTSASFSTTSSYAVSASFAPGGTGTSTDVLQVQVFL